jgi:ribosomal protein S24E
MVAAAAKAEPGSKKELTFVKEVNTRFGRSQTTGIALIYGDAEAATLEPEYVHTRHEAIHSPKAKEDSTEQTEEGGDE